MKRRGLIVSLVAIVAVSVGGVIATLVTDTKPQLGLDLQGGASVTLQPVGEADTESLEVVTEILRNRIDSLGVAEPEIIRQGQTVVVNLPGIKDQDRAIELVGRTGKVLFRPVLTEAARRRRRGRRHDDHRSRRVHDDRGRGQHDGGRSRHDGGRGHHDGGGEHVDRDHDPDVDRLDGRRGRRIHDDPGPRGGGADHPSRGRHARSLGGAPRP